MIRKTGGIGIAIENNCAIEFLGGRFYRVISSKSNSRAYRVYRTGGEMVASNYVGRSNWRESNSSLVDTG
jgi:hypothetical protein